MEIPAEHIETAITVMQLAAANKAAVSIDHDGLRFAAAFVPSVDYGWPERDMVRLSVTDLTRSEQ